MRLPALKLGPLTRISRAAATFGAGLLLGLALAASGGEGMRGEGGPPTTTADAVGLTDEVLSLIGRDYVDSVDVRALLKSALKHAVSGLDPYSELLEPADYEALKTRTSGAYVGIGVELDAPKGELLVSGVSRESPASRAGILRGDRLLAAEGEPLGAIAPAVALSRLRGPDGSVVHLTLARAGRPQPFTLAVTRGAVHLRTVAGRVLPDQVGYVRIGYFNDATPADLTRTMLALEAENKGPLRSVILDLRGNPGGVLEAGIAVADEFLDAGVIVRSVGRNPDANFVARATGGDLTNGRPLAVLIDGASASAAEIVAGALKENHRAVLVGQTTYGKGSVQTILPLKDGSALRLTTARYFGPAGHSLSGHGLEPDIRLPASAAVSLSSDPERAAAQAPWDPEVAAAIANLPGSTAASLAAASLVRSAVPAGLSP